MKIQNYKYRFLLFVSTLAIFPVTVSAQSLNWKIAGDRIVTPWAEKVNPTAPLPEYPRPQMVRSEWKNLNGLWDYSITAVDAAKPVSNKGKILVWQDMPSGDMGGGKWGTRPGMEEGFGSKQALVLGEYGGLGLPLEGHTWLNRDNWGYRTFANADTLFSTFKTYQRQMLPFISRGLSAAIYTQTTDVEVETNGLMTYDRKVMKIPVDKLKEASQKIYEAAKEIIVKN